MEDRRQILRDFIREQGLKKGPWAREAGVNPNSLYNFLNGHSDALDLETYIKLARSAKVPVWRLTGDQPEPPSPTSLWVVGHVEAGAFRPAVEWDQALWYAVDVPVQERFRGKAKALEVRGPSMDLEYPEGSVVTWVDVYDFRPPRDGDHVIAYSYCMDDAIEATVKELRKSANGSIWLWPRSADPAHQTPINLDEPGERVRRVEIKGIVIGGYRPRKL